MPPSWREVPAARLRGHVPYGKDRRVIPPDLKTRAPARAKAKCPSIEPLFRFGLLSGVIFSENRYPLFGITP